MRKDLHLFFKFTFWGWFAILIYAIALFITFTQFDLLMQHFPEKETLWRFLRGIEFAVATYFEASYMPSVFFNFPKRRTQYYKLCDLYSKYDKIPKAVVYSMKTTNCEKIVVKQFLKDMEAKLED